MKSNKKVLFTITTLLLIIGWVLAGWFYYDPANHHSVQVTNNSPVIPTPKETESEHQLDNHILIKNQVALTIPETEQVMQSVDDFMNTYKLPKGVQNIYTVSIVERDNNAMKIIFNPSEKGALANNVLYASKTNGKWAVDANAGPWCASLKAFEENSCY